MMISKPLVSVLMPVYNGEEYLELTIRSILNQSFHEFEFIIVNDGSTDRSEEIILSIPDQRIKYIRNWSNRGLIYSLNHGISKAQGKYIARIDADDLAHYQRLEKQVEFMELHPLYALCGSFYRIIDHLGEPLDNVSLPLEDRHTRTYLLFGNCFCHSSVMIKTDVIKAYGYSPDYQLCEDYDLWFRISQKYKVVNIPEYLTSYRVHSTNISTVKRADMAKCVQLVHGRALHLLHINYTREELILHNAILNFDHEKCMQYSKVSISKWLEKLRAHIQNQNIIDQKLALKVIIRRWVTICFNAKEYNLIWANPLFKKDSGFYLYCFGEKIMDRWLDRNRGLDL